MSSFTSGGPKIEENIQTVGDVDETIDPCARELFMKNICMQKNLQDRTRCNDYFQNLENCRKFWQYISVLRQKDKVFPLLPPPEERAEIRKHFLAEFSVGAKIKSYKAHWEKKTKRNIRKET
ncbi:coiled-coil-helix-coiled-coil-helix domain-containing protein 7 [Lingula anatina]|uniref:Coiled-coil-helix-coiled-coil-helix domain-containing protein 7 n=1 Tax=Lingula anatina TaxID=7574 RepID=A0A1S3J2L9_LINAN|nr:coiled-coil-helix-coiled-coil-helix domain-containing protein 7 [Lingula anatina]|eukprot:XP_013404650.1 coiled-coil-helix-coiled-coil-helix domain-containing protein 7 [Lingula anatina]